MDFLTLSNIKDAIIIGGAIFAVYIYFRKPDEDMKNKVTEINGKFENIDQRCHFKHQFIDDNIAMIKENHLKHIESDLKLQSESIVKIFTILEERLPRK